MLLNNFKWNEIIKNKIIIIPHGTMEYCVTCHVWSVFVLDLGGFITFSCLVLWPHFQFVFLVIFTPVAHFIDYVRDNWRRPWCKASMYALFSNNLMSRNQLFHLYRGPLRCTHTEQKSARNWTRSAQWSIQNVCTWKVFDWHSVLLI